MHQTYLLGPRAQLVQQVWLVNLITLGYINLTLLPLLRQAPLSSSATISFPSLCNMVCHTPRQLCTCAEVCPIHKVSVVTQALAFEDDPDMPPLEHVENDDYDDGELFVNADTETLVSAFKSV